MIKIQLPDKTNIVIYDDAIQMPAELYKEFQKYLLQDGGIGSTMEDIGARFSTFFQLVAAGKNKEARIEAENLYYTHYMILEKINFKQMAFGCLIHSVDDKPFTDRTEISISEMLKTLSDKGLTQKMIEDAVRDSKKNSNPN